jgi:protein-L-isoaspartate(D-aspartate) O-methyltransferase
MPAITTDQNPARESMVQQQIAARGIRNPAVLEAMRQVPREAFLPEDLEEFAYLDIALPIPEGQTISQPYVVALMAEAADIGPDYRVLEIGTGSGYAAAVLSRIAHEVYTVERHKTLADQAERRLRELGYDNVHVRHGDGTLGWPEHAPYDAILVAAGGPQVPSSLREQLKVGGRLVIPVGESPGDQDLLRVTRTREDTYEEEDLGPVRFVPLVGQEGWEGHDGQDPRPRSGPGRRVSLLLPPAQLATLVREAAEPIADIDTAGLGALLERVKGCRVVLIGEATHGTSEFYRMRQRITQELVRRHGFTIVAAEADWPDAARIDHYVRGADDRRQTTDDRPSSESSSVDEQGALRAANYRPSSATEASTRPSSVVRRPSSIFNRFPTWMWRNHEVLGFVEWLREHNTSVPPEQRTGFYGLDLYSLFSSIYEVLRYLDQVDPGTASVARFRYACLTPFESDPATYGHAALTGRYRSCETDVVQMLKNLLDKRLEYSGSDGESFFDATQNARVVAGAEKYYRAMYYGSAESWNLRDRHMFETLESLLSFRGPDAKAVVWAHNSHVGNVLATEMSARGEINIGSLSREKFGDSAYEIGFGTDHGTVAAASDWGGEVETMRVRPSHADSYERLCHDSGVSAFLLQLRDPQRQAVRDELQEPRLERAIGVIYRPDTELLSHYFQASLPRQFDEYIWFDETHAVHPLGRPHAPSLPQAHPFALLDE